MASTYYVYILTNRAGWLRRREVELIDSFDPLWADLGESIMVPEPDSSLRSE